MLSYQKSNLRGGQARADEKGFTLIELLVTLAIGTVLMMVAVPSFMQFQRNAQLSDTVSNFIAAANTARASAMKQGVNTYLIPNNTGTGWTSGWKVFTDKDFDQAYTAGEEIVLNREAIGGEIIVKTAATSTLGMGYLMFNGSGYPKMKNGAPAAATIEMGNSFKKSSVIIDFAGRVRSCATGATGCPVIP